MLVNFLHFSIRLKSTTEPIFNTNVISCKVASVATRAKFWPILMTLQIVLAIYLFIYFIQKHLARILGTFSGVVRDFCGVFETDLKACIVLQLLSLTSSGCHELLPHPKALTGGHTPSSLAQPSQLQSGESRHAGMRMCKTTADPKLAFRAYKCKQN